MIFFFFLKGTIVQMREAVFQFLNELDVNYNA